VSDVRFYEVPPLKFDDGVVSDVRFYEVPPQV